ncbi:MAG TPA: hypothetical protein VE420_09740 [Gemmatimonadales bacterium]|jgi:hypothetical protein|nr:hypothetical protein [Gemmatimonadales bacterium]HZA99230.1 hypothetical protein [Gemmatimonadales bacterium]
MPFKSKAQRRKFAELLVKGEISEETFEEWNRETGGAKLPERVKPSKKRSSKPASGKRAGKTKAGSQSKGKRKSVTKRPVRRKNT